LAIISIKEDGTFLSANDTTPKYAYIMAVYRALILYSAKYDPTSDDFIADVRIHTKRMLMHPMIGQSPGPISWILNAWSYARAITKDMVNPGICYWQDDTIHFRAIRLPITDFRLMLGHWVKKTKELLASLLFLDESFSCIDFPAIQWNKIIDDIGNTNFGYSFLSDERNDWILSGRNFLMEKVVKDTNLCDEWFDSDKNTVRLITLDRFGMKLD
jgi:hypothetical protein